MILPTRPERISTNQLGWNLSLEDFIMPGYVIILDTDRVLFSNAYCQLVILCWLEFVLPQGISEANRIRSLWQISVRIDANQVLIITFDINIWNCISCRVYVSMCVCMCSYMNTHVLVETRDRWMVSSSIITHLQFWDKASHWTL